MKPITKIYLITDISFRMSRKASKIQESVTKAHRALALLPNKTKLSVIGYNDRARFLHPSSVVKPEGNPNLGKALKLLKSALALEKRENEF